MFKPGHDDESGFSIGDGEGVPGVFEEPSHVAVYLRECVSGVGVWSGIAQEVKVKKH